MTRGFIFLFIVAALPAVSFGSSPKPEDPPMPDPDLVSVLRVPSVFELSKPMSLRQVAQLLYGHRTWWPKLLEQNPSLAYAGPDEKLPAKTSIRYFSPKIGNGYTVRRNDTLTRIAIWRYGETKYWQNIFTKNYDLNKNPNLIYPGELLQLSDSGIITDARTGRVVYTPTPTPEPQLRAPASAPVATAALSEAGMSFGALLRWIFAAFGTLAAASGALWFYLTKPRNTEVAQFAEPAVKVEAAAVDAPAVEAVEPKIDEKILKNRRKLDGKMTITPIVEHTRYFDRDRVRRDGNKIDLKPTYLSLLKWPFRKFLH